MDELVFNILGAVFVVDWYLYIAIILPKIRKHRKIYLADWGFSLNQPLLNIFEYKKLCEKDNEPILWYKIQIGILIAIVVILFFWMLI